MTIRIAIVGLGKIARDQHLPVIADNPDFELAAIVSQRGLTVGEAAGYRTLEDLIAGDTPVDAVSLCTPPEAHYHAVRAALEAGLHVLLEKPPTVTITEFDALSPLAEKTGKTLFATWHSRHNASVDHVRDYLANRRVKSLAINWKEDVRHWHPGQAWIWERGGFGVFDPGINALSILTKVMPEPVFVETAHLEFPANKAMPIAAQIGFRTGSGVELSAEFDWRQTGPQTWRFDIETDDGSTIVLDKGGRDLSINGEPVLTHGDEEYADIYRDFASLVSQGQSDIDGSPLRLVADAFLVGRRTDVEEFFDDPVG